MEIASAFLPIGAKISIENKIENGNCIGVFAHRAKISIKNEIENGNYIGVFARRGKNINKKRD